MNGEINGVFIYNGQPQNGATAQLWKITGFAAYADSTDTVQDDPLAATSIELNVGDGTKFAVGQVIKMETELCRIADISTDLLYIIRAYRGTTAAAHVQTTQIDIETVTEPAQDTAVPAGYQQGGDVTTGVAYGGDGAYRWTAVPEGEYYVSVTYDSHIAWLYASVENNDPTPLQILRADGDMMIHNADRETRLPAGTIGHYLRVDGSSRPAWQGGSTASLTVAETEVFALGAAPNAWTDLDLSAVVGSNLALVLLKVQLTNTSTIAFRQNGDAEEHYSTVHYGANIAKSTGAYSDYTLVVVHTDNAGKVEWKKDDTDNVTIDVVAFVN